MVEAVDNAASIEEGELQHGAEAELGPLRVGWLVCRLEELLPAERFVGGHAHPLVHGPAGGDPGRAVPLVHLAVRTGQPERPRAQHARPGDIGSEHKARRLSLQRALQVRLDDVEAGVVALAVLDLDRQTLSAHSRCTRMNSCLSGFRVCSVTGIFATASAWVGSSLKLASSSSSGSTGVTTRSSGSVVRAMGSLHREAEGRAVEEPRVTRPEPAIAATSVDDGGVDVAALDREGRATRAVGLDEPPAAIHGARQLLVALDPVAGRRFVSNGLPQHRYVIAASPGRRVARPPWRAADRAGGSWESREGRGPPRLAVLQPHSPRRPSRGVVDLVGTARFWAASGSTIQ